MSFHNRTLTFMTPKKRILEHVLKLDENILQAEEKCSTFLTLQLLPACMSAEKTVHVQACVKLSSVSFCTVWIFVWVFCFL